MTDTKINDRRFYKAQQEADFAEQQLSTPQTQSKSYRLAFQDTVFLLREDLRPVRFQLELLITEMLLDEANIGSMLVIYGSARIPCMESWAMAMRISRISVASGDGADAEVAWL